MSASIVTSEVRSSLAKVVTTFSIVNLVFVANKVALLMRSALVG